MHCSAACPAARQVVTIVERHPVVWFVDLPRSTVSSDAFFAFVVTAHLNVSIMVIVCHICSTPRALSCRRSSCAT